MGRGEYSLEVEGNAKLLLQLVCLRLQSEAIIGTPPLSIHVTSQLEVLLERRFITYAVGA